MGNCNDLRYPIGIQTFADIREGGYIYVDKTAYIYNMRREGKYYFLSRPRRFGKSLLLSTIEAYFQGRRDLFEGLAIDTLTEDWEPHPVLHLDLNPRDYSKYDALVKELNRHLEQWEKVYGDEKKDRNVEERFSYVIQNAYEKTGRKVVILIDEYDKPMLSAINDEPLADRFRNTLKAFYGNLKSMDRYIEFGMLTGVARFSKISIFSDLNNLRDISFDTRYSAICGITNEEVDKYFHDSISCLANYVKKPFDLVRDKIKEYYDGYHFSKDLTDIYNPFSLVNLFSSNDFQDYWFNSGTPTYVVRLLENKKWILSDLEGFRIKASRLSTEGILSRDPIPSLYQAGYLTIKSYNTLFDQYILGYPNKEVEHGFFDFIMPTYLGTDSSQTEFDISRFVEDVFEGHIDNFMKRLASLLAGVPHLGPKDPYENNFQNAIYILFKMLGFYTTMEDHTSDGRIDLTVETHS